MENLAERVIKTAQGDRNLNEASKSFVHKKGAEFGKGKFSKDYPQLLLEIPYFPMIEAEIDEEDKKEVIKILKEFGFKL
jgi:hypothetical protein